MVLFSDWTPIVGNFFELETYVYIHKGLEMTGIMSQSIN